MRRKRGFIVIVVGVVVSVLLAVSVSAVPVDGIQFNLQGGPIFFKIPVPPPTLPGELFVNEYHGDPGTISGHLLLPGGSWEDYEIRDAIFDLSASSIIGDESYTDSNPMNPKIAKGQFDAGAIVTISGSITTTDGAVEVFPTGTILEAVVTNQFWVEEKKGLPYNLINMQLDLTITGGELATGAVTGFQLYEQQIGDITLNFCSQPDNPALAVEDFASDIWYLSPSMVQIYPIPEPMSVSLLALGGLLVLRKKR